MPDFSLLAIPAYFVAVFYPHTYSHMVLARSKNPRAYNNVMPRNAPAAAEKALTPSELGMYQRSRMAHNNGLEGFPVFVAGILAAKWAGIDVDRAAWIQVGLRVLYSVLYIYTTRGKTSLLRSLVWVVMTVWSFYLVGQAAYAQG